MYDFKSKAILCDLELSKNVHREDVNFTYIPVSDDPLNVRIKNYLSNYLLIYYYLFR